MFFPLARRLFLPLFFSQICLFAGSPVAPAIEWVKTVSASGSSASSGVATDTHGNFYIAGSTTSLDFPTVRAAQPNAGGSPLIRINPTTGVAQKIYSSVLATATSITVDPENPQTLYATSGVGLLSSTDAGNTWKILVGFPSVTDLNSIVVDPANTSILYAATAPLGVLKSTNGGASWTAMNTGIPSTSMETVNAYGFSASVQSYNVHQLWVDPKSPNVLFASANQSFLRSADGGASWTTVTFPVPVNGTPVADPFTKGKLYLTVGGILFTSANDGETWTTSPQSSSSFPTVLAADPFHQGTLYGGSATGLFVSADYGQTWISKINGGTSEIAPDPNKAVVYANVGVLGIVASTDGFNTYTSISPANGVLARLPVNQIQVAGSSLFVVDGASSDVFVTKLDPGGNVVYSTYLGGSAADTAGGIAVGADGSVYVTGATSSPDFPVTKGAYAPSGSSFVFKLNPDGSLAWSTYFADIQSSPISIAVDSGGNTYIGGQVYGGLPVTSGAYETQFVPLFTCNPGDIGPCFPPSSAFLTKFNPQGSALVFSTYVSQTPRKQMIQGAISIALAADGSVYFADSGFDTLSGGGAGVYRMNATGSAMLGWNVSEPAGIHSIALDASGNLFATGGASGEFDITPGAFQSPSLVAGGGHVPVMKFDSTLSNVLAATLLGGEGFDFGQNLTVDRLGNVIISGYTDSKTFPTRAPFQESFASRSGFVAGMNSSLTELLYATYLGDARPFIVQGAVPDESGNLLIAGSTQGSNGSYSFSDAGYPYSVPGTVIANKISLPSAPAVRLDSIGNYASQLGVAVSPGEVIVAAGAGFAPDAKLLMNGQPLTVFSSSANRIVAAAPSDLGTPGAGEFRVVSSGVTSNAVAIPLAAASPGLYSADGSGSGPGYVLNGDGTRNSASNPAAQGSAITIFATGVGAFTESGPYAVLDQPAAVFVDGFYASGIAAVMKQAPGFFGDVYELGVYVPDIAKYVNQNPPLAFTSPVNLWLFVGPARSQQTTELWIK